MLLPSHFVDHIRDKRGSWNLPLKVNSGVHGFWLKHVKKLKKGVAFF